MFSKNVDDVSNENATFETKCRKVIVLGRLWGGFRRLWGAFGEALGGFGDALEGFGEALGGCAETLGKLRGIIVEN